MGIKHTDFPSPGVAAVIGFAAQAKLARFESGRASGTQGIGKGVLTTPPVAGPFSRSVGVDTISPPV